MPTKRPQHIEDFIADKARADGGYAIAYALLKLADAHQSLACHVKYLGGGDNADSRGAVEWLGIKVGEGLSELAGAIRERDE